ncbi:PssE/Cps14G family polysaccharide biosynthesis glycosyltransferase [Aeromonas caviae]|uniref:PssE/Cps14G family polysaccharide biosynthesis glycosyltransferase n=1 Tax=Aeromonas caviae TaxID=648 RepID=UPI003EC89DCC
MNILVTVGTTSFDELIKHVHTLAADFKSNEFYFQIGPGEFEPLGKSYCRFTNEISNIYDWADCIITHAGAGTIYHLLEMKKKILIVPNVSRVDKHQIDIARYMERGGFALVCWSVDDIALKIKLLNEFTPVEYMKCEFFKYNEIAEFINE